MRMMAEPQIRFCTTADGVSIAYYAMGEGHPFVMASPGGGWNTLRSQMVREYHRSRSGNGLGRGLQVIRYDGRGTGLSARHALDFSMPARQLDFEAVVEQLGLARFAVFGLINSAPAAITYAAGHPERVSHLILVNPYARGRDYVGADRAFASLRDTADEDWKRYSLTMANVTLGFTDSESARKMADLFRESMTPESMRAFYTAQEAIDVTSLLPEVRVPTLVMQGGAASLVQREWSQEVAAKIPAARFVAITKRDDPRWTDEETRIIEEFLGVQREASAAAAPTPAARAAGRSVVTVLFTDLVGHAEMMQRLGDDKGRDVLREHEHITRETLAAHGGAEVKTMGDGFMASFGSVTKAMDCAIALQRAFASHNADVGATHASPLNVRVGLNAGEPIEEDGDLFGSTVILASRIAAQAGAGEILIPEPLRHLLSGKSYVYADRGETMLKGFEDAVRLYEVRWQE
jgi:class 3 adenylate cyclase